MHETEPQICKGREGRKAGVDAVGYGREKIMVPLGAVESLWVPLGAERFGCRRGKQRNPDGSGLRSGGVGGIPSPSNPSTRQDPHFTEVF
jgi:hypothetical protein